MLSRNLFCKSCKLQRFYCRQNLCESVSFLYNLIRFIGKEISLNSVNLYHMQHKSIYLALLTTPNSRRNNLWDGAIPSEFTPKEPQPDFLLPSLHPYCRLPMAAFSGCPPWAPSPPFFPDFDSEFRQQVRGRTLGMEGRQTQTTSGINGNPLILKVPRRGGCTCTAMSSDSNEKLSWKAADLMGSPMNQAINIQVQIKAEHLVPRAHPKRLGGRKQQDQVKAR